MKVTELTNDVQLVEGPMMKDRKPVENRKVQTLIGKYPQAEDAIRTAYKQGLMDGQKS